MLDIAERARTIVVQQLFVDRGVRSKWTDAWELRELLPLAAQKLPEHEV
jgi:hypothetical protein